LDHIGFWVTDVDRTYGELVRNGAEKAAKPFSAGKYRLGFVEDPDGNWIKLIGYKSKKNWRGHAEF
jgi:catechol 2,3-dioxygenase-like lactoylglutathione lyase family enzyme